MSVQRKHTNKTYHTHWPSSLVSSQGCWGLVRRQMGVRWTQMDATKEQSKTNYMELMGCWRMKNNKKGKTWLGMGKNKANNEWWCLPELGAERGDLPRHRLAAVCELLQIPLQLPLLSVGARILLLHLLQLPLQLLQSNHWLIQLQWGRKTRLVKGLRWKGEEDFFIPPRNRRLHWEGQAWLGWELWLNLADYCLMMVWEESVCFCCGWRGLIFSGRKAV